jgi:hypothetical protein
MATKDFFKKLKGAEDDFQKGREGRPQMINLEDGKYVFRFHSLELDVNQQGNPYAQINSVVVNAENDDDLGQLAKTRIDIVDRKGDKNGKKWHISIADCFSEICTVLQAYGADTSELEISDLDDLGEQLAEEQPAAKGEVKTNAGGYKKIKWGKPVDDDDLPTIEDVYEDDDDDVDDEDEVDDDQDNEEPDDSDDDDDDDNDSDDDDDDDLEPPAKGDEVQAKPKGTRKFEDYTVKTSNKAKELCTLVRDRDDKEFKNVPWSLIK